MEEQVELKPELLPLIDQQEQLVLTDQQQEQHEQQQLLLTEVQQQVDLLQQPMEQQQEEPQVVELVRRKRCGTKNLPCHLCSKAFSTRSNINHHLRTKHGVDTTTMASSEGNYQFECIHDECKANDVRFHTAHYYRQHLEKQHAVTGISVPTQLTFSTFEDFMAWKEVQEKKDVAKFVSCRGECVNRGVSTWQFKCNRSGSFKTKGSGQRRMKLNGSCKSGVRCPACVLVSYRGGDTYHVNYYSMHYGHDKMLSHLPLTPSVRQHIAGQLAQGISPDKILRNIRLSVDNEFDRSHLITRKDLHNIRQSYCINRPDAPGAAPPAPPAPSTLGIFAWVQEMQELGGDSPVLYYKQVGDEAGRLNQPTDFILVLMNPLQRKMLLKFGQDRVAVDTTYGGGAGGALPGAGRWVYELTTLLVVDDYEEGFPVAFMCSSTLDGDSLREFFESIRTAVGEVQPMCVLCDDASGVVYGAWAGIMGPVSKRQQYTQHVDRTGGRSKDPSAPPAPPEAEADMRQAVLKALRGCHAELKSIKHAHLEPGATRKIDKLIDALCSFVLDKQFVRLAKLHKGKLSGKLAGMVQGHAEGAALAPHTLSLGGEGRWEVPSATTPNQAYAVQRADAHECSAACTVVCRQCGACLAGMSCACDDFQLQGNLCAHIHAAALCELRGAGTLELVGADEVVSAEAKDEIELYMSTLRAKHRSSRYDELLRVTQEISALAGGADLDIDDAALAGVLSHLKAAKGLMIVKRGDPVGRPNRAGLVNEGRPPAKRGRPRKHPVDTSLATQINTLLRDERNGAGPRGGGGATADSNIVLGDVILSSEHGLLKTVNVYGGAEHRGHSAEVEAILKMGLTLKDQLSVANSEPLTERHVDYAMALLRQQFPGLAGLEPTQLFQSAQGFSVHADSAQHIVQIHSTGDAAAGWGHWVTSTRARGESAVTLYDSFLTIDLQARPITTPCLQLQLTQIYRCADRDLRLVFPEMSRQGNRQDSAIYAIATATDICHGNNPYQRAYSRAEMRSHLLKCYERRSFTPFPANYINRARRSLSAIPVYCYCRGPGTDAMVECVECRESFHCGCVEYTGGDYKCATCCNTIHIQYVTM